MAEPGLCLLSTPYLTFIQGPNGCPEIISEQDHAKQTSNSPETQATLETTSMELPKPIKDKDQP